jgi:hypothetical protein
VHRFVLHGLVLHGRILGEDRVRHQRCTKHDAQRDQ